MTRIAILGLGARGSNWAERALSLGWRVAGFDPDQSVATPDGITRFATISDTVTGSALVLDCAPERLALKRKLFQTAQAAMVRGTILASTSPTYTAQELQGCATRPHEIFLAEGSYRPSGPAADLLQRLIAAKST